MNYHNIPILEGWITEEAIGKGGFGTVYRIRREGVLGVREVSALKELSIPQDENEVRVLRASGMDDQSISSQFSEQVQDIVREYKLMIQLKNCPNIVHCHDFLVTPKGLGFQVLLRMELLAPLTAELKRGGLNSQQAILKLGSDMCNALQVCHDKGILHRDVKPQNMFLAPDGNFKLGDFGIARTMEKNAQATSGIGTYNYMAPEVFNNRPYDARADIYSLGMVLYNLLNGNRGPFLPPAPAPLTPELLSQARNRRFSGEPLPPPLNGSNALKAIVLKACAFQSRHRYRTAAQLKQDLDALAQGREDCLIALRQEQEEEEDISTSGMDEDKTIVDGSQPRRPKWLIPVLAGAAALAIAAGGYLMTRPQVSVKETAPTTQAIAPTEITEPIPVLAAPTLSHEPGSYEQILSLTSSHPDPEAEIYVTAQLHSFSDIPRTYLRRDELYLRPLSLFRGRTEVSVYAKKGDLISETVSATYSVNYPEQEVTFQERALEQLVRTEAEKSSGTLTNFDCEVLTHLSWFDLEGSYQIATLDDLQYLPRVKYMYISDQNRLTDLSGLQYCPNLETLSFFQTKMENLDYLEYAPSLTDFSTYDCGITDVSGLSHLSYLETLDLTEEKISYDALLSQEGILPNLKTLKMHGEQLTDYSLLSRLPKLEALNIHRLEGIDLEGLSQLTSLKKLKLEPYRYGSDMIPADLSFLKNMTGLEQLSLVRAVYDPAQLTNLYGLTNLKTLVLSKCPAAEDEAAMEALRAALPDCFISTSELSIGIE